jgi:hypothetical protein
VGIAFIVDASVPGAASVEVVLGLYLVTALLLR